MLAKRSSQDFLLPVVLKAAQSRIIAPCYPLSSLVPLPHQVAVRDAIFTSHHRAQAWKLFIFDVM